METYHLSQMTDGWFVGNFKPTAFQTSAAEVAFKQHKANEEWPEHYQKQATEINLMLKGVLHIGNQMFTKGDIFVIPPLERAKPYFFTDVELVCVKIPSLPGDKITVE